MKRLIINVLSTLALATVLVPAGKAQVVTVNSSLPEAASKY